MISYWWKLFSLWACMSQFSHILWEYISFLQEFFSFLGSQAHCNPVLQERAVGSGGSLKTTVCPHLCSKDPNLRPVGWFPLSCSPTSWPGASCAGGSLSHSFLVVNGNKILALGVGDDVRKVAADRRAIHTQSASLHITPASPTVPHQAETSSLWHGAMDLKSFFRHILSTS